MNLKNYLIFSSKISAALRADKPILAIAGQDLLLAGEESERLAKAKALMCAVQAEGVEPAVLYILNGQMHIGLDDDELTQCCKLNGSVPLSGLPLCLSQGASIAPQSSAALFMAGLCGIRTVSAVSCPDESEAVHSAATMPAALVTAQNHHLPQALLAACVPVYSLFDSHAISPQKAAELCLIKWDLGLTGGVCFYTSPEYGKANDAMQNAIYAAKIAYNF